jgi:tryptophanyl-tRNA synthetase
VNKDIFHLPLPVIPTQSARIMSLRDGTSKMSKSDISDYSRIHLLDDADQLALKIRKAKTDSLPIPATADELTDRPEAKNLLGIYATLTNTTLAEVCAAHQGQLFSQFKQQLCDAVVSHLGPIRDNMTRLMNDKTEMDRILARGATRANELASATLDDVRAALNMYPRPR